MRPYPRRYQTKHGPGRHAVAAVLGILVLTACERTAPADESQGDRGVTTLGPRDVASVERRPLRTGVEIAGSLDPADRVEIKARLGARVDEVAVDRGSRVRRGQILARLEGRTVQSQLASARSRLVAAERDYEAARVLFEAGATSERDFVNARAAWEAAMAEVTESEVDVADATVTTPISGVISQRSVNTGEAVQVGQSLFTVVNSSTLELRGEVVPEELARVRVGQRASLSLDAYPGREVEGQVVRIEPIADEGTRRVGVFVRVSNDAEELVGGLFASGVILTEDRTERPLTIPAQGLVSEGDRFAAFVVSDGRIERRHVTPGARDETAGRVEILSGLSEGEQVVLAPGARLTGGDSVRVLESTPLEAADSSGPGVSSAANGDRAAGVATRGGPKGSSTERELAGHPKRRGGS